MQHMIEPLIDPNLLQRQHIERLLHHTDLILIAGRVATNGTGIGFRDIKAARTEDNALLHANNSLRQATSLVGGATQEEESQALCRLHADARQLRELFNQRRHWWCNIAHSFRTVLEFSCPR